MTVSNSNNPEVMRNSKEIFRKIHKCFCFAGTQFRKR